MQNIIFITYYSLLRPEFQKSSTKQELLLVCFVFVYICTEILFFCMKCSDIKTMLPGSCCLGISIFILRPPELFSAKPYITVDIFLAPSWNTFISILIKWKKIFHWKKIFSAGFLVHHIFICNSFFSAMMYESDLLFCFVEFLSFRHFRNNKQPINTLNKYMNK